MRVQLLLRADEGSDAPCGVCGQPPGGCTPRADVQRRAQSRALHGTAVHLQLQPTSHSPSLPLSLCPCPHRTRTAAGAGPRTLAAGGRAARARGAAGARAVRLQHLPPRCQPRAVPLAHVYGLLSCRPSSPVTHRTPSLQVAARSGGARHRGAAARRGRADGQQGGAERHGQPAVGGHRGAAAHHRGAEGGRRESRSCRSC